MSKISKIFHAVFFSIAAVIGIITLINNLTIIGDVFGEYSDEYTIITWALDLVISLGTLLIGGLSLLHIFIGKTTKYKYRMHLVFTFFSLSLLAASIITLIMVADMKNQFGMAIDIPGEVYVLMIFGILLFLASLFGSIILKNVKPMIVDIVIGSIALVASIIVLSMGASGLAVLIYILYMVLAIALGAFDIGLKYFDKEYLDEEYYDDGDNAEVLENSTTRTNSSVRENRTPIRRSNYVCIPVEELRQVKALLDEGIIDEDDYKVIKGKIINKF